MKDPIIISVGSGKGGVGKSSMVANIGSLIAQKGFRVGFIDADLGGANLHLCLGVRRPASGLQDFISGREKQLSQVAVETAIPNSWLISGASDIMELANPKYGQKQKIISQLRKMEADFIFVDLGAGTDANVVDFFAAFPNAVLVSDSLPTSIENAYGFVKNGIVRGIMRLFPGRADIRQFLQRFSDPKSSEGLVTFNDFITALRQPFPAEAQQIADWIAARRTYFILNMVKSQEDVVIGKRFTEIVRKYLTIKLYYVGYMVATPEIPQSIREMRPCVAAKPGEQTLNCITSITNNLLALVEG